MALYHFSTKLLSRSSRNTVRAVAYRAGCKLYDDATGQTFNYTDKPVQHVELVLPHDAPQWARDLQKLIVENRQAGVQSFVNLAEFAEKRRDARVWREFEFALHRELTDEQNIALAREFVQDQLCSRGMAAQMNFHFDIDELTGEAKPHCHVLAVTRHLEAEGLSPKKEVEWDSKSFLFELREQWAHYSNFHLKLHGHDVQIDHRSNAERGIEMEPQPKCSRSVHEQEKRLQNLEGGDLLSPVTDKMQAFQAVQLRNLYRILRNPEVVLDSVTKHHATFMWGDVQKKLHQYVDQAALLERLEFKLKRSPELILLGEERVRDTPGILRTQNIYTTHSMLKAEKSLIEHAQALGSNHSHGVQEKHIVKALAKDNEDLKKYGGLSQDQVKAIHHLVESRQINCVVGIAGAGKTTALGVCHEIWKAEGYVVYGLAPTGKASQSLRESALDRNGIPSTTLHKFLKEFEEGRCQYNANSVLILDEAGMVDVERFSQLLGAVKQLGVKLIVVGDGAQLQPVEAGPAFRLVTEKLGTSNLNTVLRQKEDWQKEATRLFGEQKTREALKKYDEHGCIHIAEEKLPSLSDVFTNKDYEGLVHLYETAARVSALVYREMAKDVQREFPELKKLYPRIRKHEDFSQYLEWKEKEKDAAEAILHNAKACRPHLEARAVDPLKIALLFKDRRDDLFTQQQKASALLKKYHLDHLIGVKKGNGLRAGQNVDVRKTAKEDLIHAWHKAFQENPKPRSAILAFSNRDVNDLNHQARSLLKKSGHISSQEFTFKITREIEDDFGKEHTFHEEKSFSKGDQIVFTKNNYGLEVSNGTMGTIIDVNSQKIRVKLHGSQEISFAPALNPYFDHGWAITIHKSQGSTVDFTFVLASFEMTMNLTYVAMTRHREGVKVFGSSLDFWRPEKLSGVLSKSGEKLSAADYLDADTLTTLMKQDDYLITRFFRRMGNELEAMGAVTKCAFQNVADHFLGIKREKEIYAPQEGIREEVRAEVLFQQKRGQARNQGEKNISPLFTPKPPTRESPFIDARMVEAALKYNLAAFADEVFSSEAPYNRETSSATERRYGKKGHIAVNLKTGAWIDHKDPDRVGGPLHMLTKIRGLSYKEAVEYGASWTGIRPTHSEGKAPSRSIVLTSQKKREEEDLSEKTKTKKAHSLWAKGQPLQGTLAETYLKEHRRIVGNLPQDLCYLPPRILGNSSPPALMAAARSKEGEVTAVQLTFLDLVSATKAKIPVPKRSFGSLKGSAVTIQEDKGSNLLLIAEGVETALSLKEAGLKGTIKASLGLANIKRLTPPAPKTHIIICADHDAPGSPAAKSLDKAVFDLRAQGFKVTFIKPDLLGEDFNDVLRTQGVDAIRDIFKETVPEVLISPSLVQKGFPSPAKTVSEKSKPQVEDKQNKDTFQNMVKACEGYLYHYLKKENISLSPKLRERIPFQAERAAHLLFYSHTIRGIIPKEVDTKYALLRAKFELDRIPEIKEKLEEEWKTNGSSTTQSPLLIHMVAERLAAIEGRLFLNDKKAGRKPSSRLSELAERELVSHQVQAKPLAQKIMTKHALSENAALHCTTDILRYKETHGEWPTQRQVAIMTEIAHKLETQYPSSHNTAYMRRLEGDALFRGLCCQDKAVISLEQEHIQNREPAMSLERATAQKIHQGQKEMGL